MTVAWTGCHSGGGPGVLTHALLYFYPGVFLPWSIFTLDTSLVVHGAAPMPRRDEDRQAVRALPALTATPRHPSFISPSPLGSLYARGSGRSNYFSFWRAKLENPRGGSK